MGSIYGVFGHSRPLKETELNTFMSTWLEDTDGDLKRTLSNCQRAEMYVKRQIPTWHDPKVQGTKRKHSISKNTWDFCATLSLKK